MTERRLMIGQQLLQRILEHCLEEKPLEACGILTGKGGRVYHAYATDNAKRSPVFFEVDSEQQALVLRAMEARGEELVAIYHSHPTAPPLPSRSDIDQAIHYPDTYRVIIAVSGPTDLRAYLIREGKASAVTIAITADGGGQFHDLRRSGGQHE